MVFQRGFLLIDLVRAFGFDYPVVPVIVYEYVLFQDTAHVQDFFLVICPVERGGVRDEDFSLGGGNKNVRLNVPERVLDKTVETIIDGHYYYQCCCACRHADRTYRGDNVDDIV